MCSVCSKFKASRVDAISAIVGADSVRTNNVKNHAQSDQHTHAMLLKERARKSCRLRSRLWMNPHDHDDPIVLQ